MQWIVSMDFVDCRAGVIPRGTALAPTAISYFHGPKESWKTGIRAYAELVYADLWPGIDLVYSTGSSELKS